MRYSVTVKPNSRKGPLVELQSDGSLVVFIRQPAVEGRANTALKELLAVYFNTSKTNVDIIKGHNSRYKIVNID